MWELYQLSYDDDPEGVTARFTTQALAEQAMNLVNKDEAWEEHSIRRVEAYSDIETFRWQHDLNHSDSADSSALPDS